MYSTNAHPNTVSPAEMLDSEPNWSRSNFLVGVCFLILWLFPIIGPQYVLPTVAFVALIAFFDPSSCLFVLGATSAVFFTRSEIVGQGYYVLTPTRIVSGIFLIRILLTPGWSGIVQAIGNIRPALRWVLFGLMFWHIFSAIAFGAAHKAAISLVAVLFIILCATLMFQVRHLSRVVWMLILAGVLMACYYPLSSTGLIDEAKRTAMSLDGDVVARITAARQDPNYEGSLLAPVAAALLLLSFSSRTSFRAARNISLSAVLVYGVFMGGSRAAFVTLVACSLVAVFFGIVFPSRRKWLGMLMLSIGAIVFVTFVLSLLTSETDLLRHRFSAGGASSRWDVWGPAWDHIMAHPFPDAAAYFQMSHGRVAHNVILDTSVYTGWLGFVLTVLLFSYTWIRSFWNILTTSSRMRVYVTVLHLFAIGTTLMLMTMGSIGHKMFLATAIAVSMPALWNQQTSGLPEEENY